MQNYQYKKHNIDFWKNMTFGLKLYNTNYIKVNGLHFNIVSLIILNIYFSSFNFL